MLSMKLSLHAVKEFCRLIGMEIKVLQVLKNLSVEQNRIFSAFTLNLPLNSKSTQVTRKFSSLEGKVVWESRFLVPGENCEASLELVSKQNPGVKIGIKKDKLLFYEADGKDRNSCL